MIHTINMAKSLKQRVKFLKVVIDYMLYDDSDGYGESQNFVESFYMPSTVLNALLVLIRLDLLNSPLKWELLSALLYR